jgi:hypothetical protein
MKKLIALSTLAMTFLISSTAANAATLVPQGDSYEQGAYQEEAPKPYGYNSSQNSTLDSTDTNKINWHFDLKYVDEERGGKSFAGTPAIDKDGIVYANNSSGYVYAFNKDGSVKWKVQDIGGINNFNSIVIAKDGTLYNPANKKLYAMDPEDGSIKWEAKTEQTSSFNQVVIDNEGTIFALNNNSSDAVLYAFNSDGTVKYKGNSNVSKYGTQAQNKKMVLGKNGLIYVFTNYMSAHYLLAFNKNGDLVWNHAINYGNAGYDLDKSGNIIITGGISSSRQVIYKINGETGEVMIEPNIFVPKSSNRLTAPTVDYTTGDIYVNANRTLFKFDQNLNVIWSKPLDASGEILIDKSGNLLFTANEGIFKLNSDGEEIWKLSASELSSTGAITISNYTPGLDSEGRVYVAYQSSRLNETYGSYDFISIGDPIMQLDNTCVNLQAVQDKIKDGTLTKEEKEAELSRLKTVTEELENYTPTN